MVLFYLFCLITCIQLFYYLFFFSRLAFYKPKKEAVSQTHPVSVIICARDEASNLAKNLPGVLVQQYSTTHEVIVVNDNSFDDSKYLLEEFQRSFRQLKVTELKQEAKLIPGKKFPLSIGIKAAQYEIVLLTDADCVPASESWIKNMQETYREGTQIVLGYGAYHKNRSLLNKFIRWETFHTALQYFSFALAGQPYMGVGRNLSYKKELFFNHKGFSSHNKIASGDDDLFINMAATKTNTRINIDPSAFTLSNPAISWKGWFGQKSRHYSTGRYYQPVHKFLLGLYSLTHFLFYPFFGASLFFGEWKLSLIIFGCRFLVQGIITFMCAKKLNERDLFPWFLFFDIWMMIYYLVFSFSIIRKPRPSWR